MEVREQIPLFDADSTESKKKKKLPNKDDKRTQGGVTTSNLIVSAYVAGNAYFR